MDRFPDVYREVSLLNLKYQHLMDVCRILLEKWPNHSPSGKVTRLKSAQKEASTEQHSSEESTTKSFDPPKAPTDDDPSGEPASSDLDEINHLEDILKKAEKIRTSQPDKKTLKVRKTSRPAYSSTKLATQVYRSESKSVKRTSQKDCLPAVGNTSVSNKRPGISSISSNTRTKRRGDKQNRGSTSTRLKPTSSSHLDSQDTKRSIYLTSDHSDSEPHLSNPPSYWDGSQQQHQAKTGGVLSGCLSSLPINSTVSECTDDRTACGGGIRETGAQVPPCFDLQQHGSKLAMPSKYYHLQKTLKRLNTVISQLSAGSGGEHFSKRLTSKATDSHKAVGLQLARDEYTYLIEKLTSITSHDWTVLDKCSWQDILKMKLKLDVIIEHAQTLHNNSVQILPTRKTPNSTLTFNSERPFGYSSLKEWQFLASCEHHRGHLLSLKKDLLLFLHLEVMSQLFSERTVKKMTTQMLTSVLQTVYDLTEIYSKPSYVIFDQHKTGAVGTS